jgi:hypothetical protein
MRAKPLSSNPIGTHRIELGIRWEKLPDGSPGKKHSLYVLGCAQCKAAMDSDGVNVNIFCDATAEDNPNGHPSVVMGMDEIGEDG